MHVWCVQNTTDGHGLVCAAGICVCSEIGLVGLFSNKSVIPIESLER